MRSEAVGADDPRRAKTAPKLQAALTKNCDAHHVFCQLMSPSPALCLSTETQAWRRLG